MNTEYVYNNRFQDSRNNRFHESKNDMISMLFL